MECVASLLMTFETVSQTYVSSAGVEVAVDHSECRSLKSMASLLMSDDVRTVWCAR